jgi:hypothetical protein
MLLQSEKALLGHNVDLKVQVEEYYLSWNEGISSRWYLISVNYRINLCNDFRQIEYTAFPVYQMNVSYLVMSRYASILGKSSMLDSNE